MWLCCSSLLEAEFLAAIQVIVYAGAIVILFLFVIMLLGVDVSQKLGLGTWNQSWGSARSFAICVAVGNAPQWVH